MRQLIPDFILIQQRAGRRHGRFDAATIFVDISGFTSLTETLMQQRKDGAELLADALDEIFAPLVSLVYAHGGLIPLFAGDAFTAIFPATPAGAADPAPALAAAAQHAAFVALEILRRFAPDGHSVRTPYGVFSLQVKVGLAHGEVQWGIPVNATAAAFYFRGLGVDRCAHAEQQASRGQVICAAATQPLIGPSATCAAQHTEEYVCLLALSAPLAPLPLAQPRPQRAELAVFLPTAVLDLPVRAEFREICPVFLAFEEPADPAAFDAFVVAVLDATTRYNGFFYQIDCGDKGGLCVLLFGAPLTHENDALAAVECLLALQREALPVRWRAGLTFGTVWGGILGGPERCAYNCVGDVMNTAARLAIAAEWGGLWVNQGMYAHIAGACRVEARGLFTFKGKAQPQPVYHVLGELGRAASAQYSSALVGRDAELQLLRTWLEPILAGRAAGMITVSGEAGIGKSRLVRELSEQATARGICWLWCPCDAILRQSLNPFKSALRQLFGVSSTDSPQANLSRVERNVDALIASLRQAPPNSPAAVLFSAELDWARSFLAALLDLHWPDSLYAQLEPQLRFENTLAALRTFVFAQATLQPVVIELGDVHWLDKDSRQLLQMLAHADPDLPLAILCTARPHDDGQPVQLLEDATLPRHLLSLGYLTQESVQQYASQVLGSVITPAVADFLLQKSNGNPLFVEQLALHLRDQQALVVQAADGEPTCTLAAHIPPELPATLSALLVARLDRLPMQTKDVVQTAAVLGREFETPVLAHMLDRAVDVQQRVDELAYEQLWTALTPLRYLFRHELLREAAYDMQLRSRLRSLHRRAAAAMVEIHRHDLAAVSPDIAHHYDRAANDPAGAAAAAHWYGLAGDSAAAAFANDDAVRYFGRGLELTPEDDLAARYRFLLGREKVYEVQGQRTAQEACLDELARIAVRLEDPARRAEIALRRATLARLRNDYPLARAELQAAIEQAERIHDTELLMQAYHAWGRVLWQLGDYVASRVHLQHALALAQTAKQRREEAACLYDIGATHYYEGAFATARAFIARAQEVYHELGDRRGEAGALIMFGTVVREQGDFLAAQQYDLQALAICQAIGWRYGEAFLAGNIGNTAFELGDLAAAASAHGQAVTACRNLGDREGEALSMAALSLIAHLRGDQYAAVDFARTAAAIQQAIGDRHGLGYSLTYLGHAHTGLGDLAAAEDAYRQALALRHALGEENRAMDTLAGLARVALAADSVDAASTGAGQILDWLAAHGIEGVELPVQVYLTCYQVFAACSGGQAAVRASYALEQGYALLQERAANSADPALRQRYLEGIPYHRECVQAWAARGEAGHWLPTGPA